MQLLDIKERVEAGVSLDALAYMIKHSLEVTDEPETELLVAAINYQAAREALKSRLDKLKKQ